MLTSMANILKTGDGQYGVGKYLIQFIFAFEYLKIHICFTKKSLQVHNTWNAADNFCL